MEDAKHTVLLVNPPAGKVSGPYDTPDFPSLGIASLGAVLQDENIHVVCIDAKYERLNFARFEEKIKQIGQIDIVGVTSMTPNIVDAHNSVEIVKKYHPQACAVVGGCHVTALPEKTLEEFPTFDVGVVGEGEKTFPELVKALRENRNPGDVKGIVYRDAGVVKTTGPRELVGDLDSLPFPAWRLFRLSPGRLPVITARGCPFNCNFCMRVLGSKVRFRSPENAIAELKYLTDEFGVTEVAFIDETFTLNRKRLEKLLRMMLEEKLHNKINWSVQTHVNAVDFDILSLMKQAGCVRVGFGVESGNAEILRECGKGITLRQAEVAVKAAKNAGLKVNAFFIIGHPNENDRTVRDTVRFAAKLNPDFAAFGIMVPYPGTRIRDLALQGKGGYTSVSSNWEDYRKNAGRPMEMRAFSGRKLVKLQVKAYLLFYLLNWRFCDLMKLFIQNWRTVFSITGKWMKET